MSAQHVITQSYMPAWQAIGREAPGQALVLTCTCGWRQALDSHIADDAPALGAVKDAHLRAVGHGPTTLPPPPPPT